MTSVLLRLLAILTVFACSPLFLILAVIRRARRSPGTPIEFVLIPPISRRGEI
jgi:hypothetical protein